MLYTTQPLLHHTRLHTQQAAQPPRAAQRAHSRRHAHGRAPLPSSRGLVPGLRSLSSSAPGSGERRVAGSMFGSIGGAASNERPKPAAPPSPSSSSSGSPYEPSRPNRPLGCFALGRSATKRRGRWVSPDATLVLPAAAPAGQQSGESDLDPAPTVLVLLVTIAVGSKPQQR